MFYQTSSKRSRPFWLLIAGARKLLCFSAQSESSGPWSRFVRCVLTRKVHEVQLFAMLILAVRGGFIHELKRFSMRTKCKGKRSELIWDYLTGKYAGLFAGITTIACLEVCETIHRFFTDVFWMQGDIYNTSESLSTRWPWVGVALYSVIASFFLLISWITYLLWLKLWQSWDFFVARDRHYMYYAGMSNILLLLSPSTRKHILMAFRANSFKFLWRTVNSKPPKMPFGIFACTFSDNLSRNSCIHWVLVFCCAKFHKSINQSISLAS